MEKCWLSHSSSFLTCTFDCFGWFYCSYPSLAWNKASKFIHCLKHHMSQQYIGVYKQKLHTNIPIYLLVVKKQRLSNSSSFGMFTFFIWGWFYRTYPPLYRKRASNFIHRIKYHLSPQNSGVDKKIPYENSYRPVSSIETLAAVLFVIWDVYFWYLSFGFIVHVRRWLETRRQSSSITQSSSVSTVQWYI